MAKIGNLEVTTIKIANNALTGVVSGTNFGTTNLPIAIPNALGFPITITSGMVCVWHLPAGGDGASYRMRTIRQRDGAVIADRSQSISGVSSSSNTLSDGALDADATISETYTLIGTFQLFQSSGAATASIGEKSIRGLYSKR